MALIRANKAASGATTFSASGTISYATIVIDVTDYSTLDMTVSNDDNYQNTYVKADGVTIGSSTKTDPGLTLNNYDISNVSSLTIEGDVNTSTYGTSRTYTLSLS